MGSGKQISDREGANLIFLLQQGGMFWLLPYLLLNKDGVAGLFGLVPGILWGLLILFVCIFWNRKSKEQGFIPSLFRLLGKPTGWMLGSLLMVLYLVFAVICFVCFTEIISSQLLLDSPRFVLLLPIFFLAGWLAWNGLEDIVRLMTLCMMLIIFLFFLILTGSIENFAIENLLPVLLQNPKQLQGAMIHSLFFYSIYSVMFMVYPAIHEKEQADRKLVCSMLLSTGIFLLWVGLAIGVFGQLRTASLIWLPLELARMIQLGSFLERTEALLTIIWMPVVLVNGGLLLWSLSMSVHQLLGLQKKCWLHWVLMLLVFLLCMAITPFVKLLYIEQILAVLVVVLVSILLLVTLFSVWRYYRKQGDTQP